MTETPLLATPHVTPGAAPGTRPCVFEASLSWASSAGRRPGGRAHAGLGSSHPLQPSLQVGPPHAPCHPASGPGRRVPRTRCWWRCPQLPPAARPQLLARLPDRLRLLREPPQSAVQPWPRSHLPPGPSEPGRGRGHDEGRVIGKGGTGLKGRAKQEGGRTHRDGGLARIPAELQQQWSGHLLLGHNLEVRKVREGLAPATWETPSPCLLTLVARQSPASVSLCGRHLLYLTPSFPSSCRPPLPMYQRRKLRLRGTVQGHVWVGPCACHELALGLCLVSTGLAPLPMLAGGGVAGAGARLEGQPALHPLVPGVLPSPPPPPSPHPGCLPHQRISPAGADEVVQGCHMQPGHLLTRAASGGWVSSAGK